MNAVDLALVVLVIVAIAGGLRVGFVARVSTWIGLGLGVLAATWTVPRSVALLTTEDANVRLVVGLVVLALTVSVVASLFQTIGARAQRSIAAGPLSRVDRVAGGLAGAAAAIALVWFLLPAVGDVSATIAREVRTSVVAATLRDLTPPPPDASETLRALVDSSRFPEVFADMAPPAAAGPPPDAVPVSQAVVDRVTAATVRVSSAGCGRRYEGSGFAVGQDLLATNAHVIAGAEAVTIHRTDGVSMEATVVAFDPDRDLALLAVADLALTPLPQARLEVGDEGVSIGYPGGQATPRVAPLRIDERRSALGRDIYGVERTERQVLFLSADLRQGDSGSPVVDVDGNVGAVVFAISPDDPTTAYALDLPELEAVLAGPRAAVGTGPCL